MITVDAWDHRGTEQKPFSNEDVVAKFERATANILTGDSARRVIDAVATLDSDNRDGFEQLCRTLRKVN